MFIYSILETQKQKVKVVRFDSQLKQARLQRAVVQNDKLAKFSDCLIDGQQRLGAILDYTNNEFPVYGLLWRELERNEQNRFLMRDLGKRMVHCFDEEKLKQVYNHLNFSGTNHKESERA